MQTDPHHDHGTRMKPALLLGRYLTLIVLVLVAAGTAAAQSAPESPSEVIRETTRQLLQTIEEHKALHGETVTDEMSEAVLEVIEPVVAFHSIARAVMGEHAEKASDDQIERFARVFRDSLLNLYLKGLITFEIDEITVHDPPPDFDPASGRATVRMEAATAQDNRYTLGYTMRTDSEGDWKVRNFIIEGVNVGLTFLNQFDGAMRRYDNDIKKVIDNWSAEMIESDAS